MIMQDLNRQVVVCIISFYTRALRAYTSSSLTNNLILILLIILTITILKGFVITFKMQESFEMSELSRDMAQPMLVSFRYSDIQLSFIHRLIPNLLNNLNFVG